MARKIRRSGKTITTRSGRVLKVHRSLGGKWTAMKEAKSLRKVNRLRGLPKSRIKRLAWRLHPKRLSAYWFSRDGGIMALKIVGIAILVGFVLTLAVFAYFRKDIKNIIADVSGSNLGGSISYYDRSGQTLLWQDYNAVKRVPVQSQDISKYIKDATIAVEDRNFYNNRGFDIKGIIRAAINNTLRRGATQGGSTLTQQLVKVTQGWQQQRTIANKAKEVILAVELERTYTKDEILTGYLNAAPYGSIDYGVQVAAADYFHKSAKDLTLDEAAFLAAIPKSPSLYSPYVQDYFNREALIARYNYVLDSMVEIGKITKKQAEVAKKVDVLAKVQPQTTKYAGIQAPYFVLAAKNEIVAKYASKGPGSANIGGWKVITTLDMNLQKIAEDTVAKNRANALGRGADAQALVAEDVKTGQVVALVGGNDFNNDEYGKINYAQWNISPGSSFKPYDYAAMIENRTDTGAGSVLYDSETKLPNYPCTRKGLPPPKGNSNCLQNYDFRYPGPETIRYALGGSRNIPAVKAMLSSVPGRTADSVNKTISTANALMGGNGSYKCYNPGVDVNTASKSDETQCYEASAIGDGAYLHLDQHVNGVASLGRMGLAFPSTYILKIFDSKDSKRPFYEWKQPKAGDVNVKQAVRPEAAYIVNNIASDPNASYLPAGYYKWHRYGGWNTAIKTGTTNNGFDGLMMAWNTKFAVGSWVGYHTRNTALRGTMEGITAPLTRGFMTAALDSLKTQPVNWSEPSGIQRLPAYVVRSHVGIGSVEPSPSTDIFPSWYKPRGATSQSSTIDRVSNKLATNCTPDLAKQTQTGDNNAERFSADIFTGAAAAAAGNTSQNDDVHSCGDERPRITLTVPDTCSGSCLFIATASRGTHPLNDPQRTQFPGTINFLVNGQVVKTVTFGEDSVTTQSYTYTPTASGNATVTAQIIDSVLYDSTSEAQSVNFSGGGNSVKLNDVSLVSAAWSGGTGPYTIKRDDTNATICTAPAGATSCNFNTVLPNDTQVTITDNTGSTDSKKAHP